MTLCGDDVTSEPLGDPQMPSVAVVLITYNHEAFIAHNIRAGRSI